MYFPQSYHHIQEIQKYNIQDYRPRYIFSKYPVKSQANIPPGWSNSKKPSEKYDKYSACVNSVVTLSPKQTNHKHVYYKPMIPPESVVDTERWPVQGQEDGNEIRLLRNGPGIV
jgi:phospholipid-transporting ATPase